MTGNDLTITDPSDQLQVLKNALALEEREKTATIKMIQKLLSQMDVSTDKNENAREAISDVLRKFGESTHG